MIIDCQLKSVLKNYLETVIVGFGQADVLGFTIMIYSRGQNDWYRWPVYEVKYLCPRGKE